MMQYKIWLSLPCQCAQEKTSSLVMLCCIAMYAIYGNNMCSNKTLKIVLDYPYSFGQKQKCQSNKQLLIIIAKQKDNTTMGQMKISHFQQRRTGD